MSEPTRDPILDEPLPPGVQLRPHEYDGIHEYDQRLPNWWLWTWYLAIIWFVIFWVCFYQFGWGKNDTQAMAAHAEEMAKRDAYMLQKMFAADPDGALWKMSRNATTLAAGQATFLEKCKPCHGSDLSATEGGVKLAGLPLNDKEWKYCGEPGTAPTDPVKPKKVFELVTNGSPDKTKGMQAWGPELGPKRIAEVVAFVLSHHEAPPEALKEAAPAPAPGAKPAGT